MGSAVSIPLCAQNARGDHLRGAGIGSRRFRNRLEDLLAALRQGIPGNTASTAESRAVALVSAAPVSAISLDERLCDHRPFAYGSGGYSSRRTGIVRMNVEPAPSWLFTQI